MSRGSITFLGTGTAFHHDGRGSQSLFVRPPVGSPFLVDVGPTIMAAANRFRVDCSEVDRLFLTHLHGDHFAGWPFLLLHFLFEHRRTRPFDVFGPEGTRETLEGLVALCYRELAGRAPFEVRYHELPVREAAAIPAGPAVQLDTLPMRHHPTSIGLRFVLKGPTGESVIAVTGDTGSCPALLQLSRGVDLLVVECTSVHPGVEGHLSLAEIRQQADTLAARSVVLVHLTDEVAEALALDPIPRVLAAHDGLDLVFSD